jgi:GT2 family glycosyltransferase
MVTIDINIVTWNSREFIPNCLQSVFQQEFKDYRILIVDNGSQDGTPDYITDNYPSIELIRNETNLGFSKAHNLAIRQSNAPYLLALNPDVILCPGFLSAVLAAIQQDDRIGAIAPRVYTIDKQMFLTHSLPVEPRLDGAGLMMQKSRRLFLRGNDKPDSILYDSPQEVFGADGAVPFYRRAMLEDIKIFDEYFDEDFFSYKEDHDLAWRARLLGWKSIYTPDAKAYHIRSVRPGNRQAMKSEFRYLGVRNRYLMMVKNELGVLFIRHLIPILFYEVKIFGFIILFEHDSWPAYREAIRFLPKMLKKRKVNMIRKRETSATMAEWFS